MKIYNRFVFPLRLEGSFILTDLPWLSQLNSLVVQLCSKANQGTDLTEKCFLTLLQDISYIVAFGFSLLKDAIVQFCNTWAPDLITVQNKILKRNKYKKLLKFLLWAEYQVINILQEWFFFSLKWYFSIWLCFFQEYEMKQTFLTYCMLPNIGLKYCVR